MSDTLGRRAFCAGLLGLGAAMIADDTLGQAAAEPKLADVLDLARPELAEVKAACDKGDEPAARAAFCRHLRARKTPKWWFDPANPPKGKGPDEAADLALAHTFDSVGIRHTFGDTIDWAYNPTTQPGSPHAADHEWTWQLNRHPFWVSLARAYDSTGDRKYGDELVRQIVDWVRNCSTPAKADQRPHSRWRTIECGIRMAFAWPEIYFRLLRHPEVCPDDALLAMVDCMRRHAEYLDAFPTTGNWLCMEANGEYHVGVLFPEFKNAAHWRDSAIGRLRRELDAQVYADGVQVELTPGYHNVSLRNFVSALSIAQLNSVPLPEGYQSRLERMYDENLWAMSPDRDVPPFNDSWSINAREVLKEGLGLFPKRADWRWVVTDGKEGSKPKHDSHFFPWAGWAVMRSGWDRDALFLMMDAGPFGYGHQHEDKLSFVIHAYGSRLVFDAGSYAYDVSAMRRYVLSARGHNVVHVDGYEQNRRSSPGGREQHVAKTPYPITWQSTRDHDLCAASFGELPDEAWGGQRLRNVVHTRRVLFAKPVGWVVIDTLQPSDSEEHGYESTFHVDAPSAAVDPSTLAVRTERKGGANLAIVPLHVDGLSARIVSGQNEPALQGWLPHAHGLTGAEPRACVYYTVAGKGRVDLLYAFIPVRPGEPIPSIAVEPAKRDHAVVCARIAVGKARPFTVALTTDGEVEYSRGG